MRPLGLLLILSLTACVGPAQKSNGTCEVTFEPVGANTDAKSLSGIFNTAQNTPSPQQLVVICTSSEQTAQLQIVLNGKPPTAGASYTLGPYGSAGGWIAYLEDQRGEHHNWTSMLGTAGITSVTGSTVTIGFDRVPLVGPATATADNSAVGELIVSGTAAVPATGL